MDAQTNGVTAPAEDAPQGWLGLPALVAAARLIEVSEKLENHLIRVLPNDDTWVLGLRIARSVAHDLLKAEAPAEQDRAFIDARLKAEARAIAAAQLDPIPDELDESNLENA